MAKPLLTIAIPTYNRAGYLDNCLNAIQTQLEPHFKNHIQVLVSDNASTDNTNAIVEKYNTPGSNCTVDYLVNEKNQGPDINIATCFDKADGKYVWVMGDDDFIIPGRLKLIYRFLEQHNVGAVNLNFIPYDKKEEVAALEPVEQLNVWTIDNPIDYIKTVSFWFSSISGMIINKEAILPLQIDYYEFKNTNLIQVNWCIQAVFRGLPNIVIQDYCNAIKKDNSGGFKVITVFSRNYHFILQSLVKRGYDKQIIPITEKKLITEFFPLWLPKVWREKHSYTSESPLKVLVKKYWMYPTFWKQLAKIFVKTVLVNQIKR